MPVLKDAECRECGNVIEIFMASDATKILARCAVCRADCFHESLCTGGTKDRWRFADWSGYDSTGAVEMTGVGCSEEVDGVHVPKFHRNGEQIDKMARFVDADKRSERRDRIKFVHDKKHGRSRTQYMDLKQR